MNILFLTLTNFNSIYDRNIYTDLLREFTKHHHSIYIISPVEKRENRKTELVKEVNTKILKLKIGNMHNTNVIEKGITTITIENTYISGIKQYFSDVKFDLVMYSTPPITFCNAVRFIKKRDNAKTYLLLKDIFPQNAVDISMLNKMGAKGLIYKFFRHKEKKLYSISDYIGCMSQANVDYIIKHNSELNSEIIEVCPNSVEIVDRQVDTLTKIMMRKKYGLPLNKKVFVYGGNLGKPQGIPFLLSCLKKCSDSKDVFFLIVGDGTEYKLLEEYMENNNPKNMKLMKQLPKEDYDRLVAACDVGMIFLDYRFTIPNFPSRLLSYMQARLPILACTDPNTDIGKVIVDGGFGWWCESNDVQDFCEKIQVICDDDTKVMGEKGYRYLEEYYGVEKGYEIIMKHFISNR